MASCGENIPQEIPLPNNWAVYATGQGRKVFVDHASKITTWTDPRDSLTRPQTFADCIGDELPYGWEVAHDEHLGEYFIDHNRGVNQLEDPRDQWRFMQDSMIRYYLSSAKESIEAKEKIVMLKQERSSLVSQELCHLMLVLQKINEKQSQTSRPASSLGSKNSLATASSSCSLYSRYDPDLLKAEIEVAKQRLGRLKFEEEIARRDLNCKQRGVATLAKIKQAIAERPQGYSHSEKNLLENELRDLKKVLSSIESEKQQLVEQVTELCNDFQSTDAKADSQLEFSVEKASCSSQTDIAEPIYANRVAALARARLRYNELKCLLHDSHQQLAALNEKMLPADLELSRDQITLINEKEQLLRELKSVCCQSDGKFHQGQNPCGRGGVETAPDQRQKLTEKMHELEEDLGRALKLTQQEMTQRSNLLQQKEDVECKIREAGRALATLELQLKSLSASTLSTCSLSTGSTSCASLASSFGALERCGLFSSAVASSSAFSSKTIDDIRRRVERSLGLTSTINATNVDRAISAPSTGGVPPTSSSDLTVHRENSVGSSGGTDTGGNRSISAAVSDESMAGDSGVFDGAVRRASGGGTALSTTTVAGSVVIDDRLSSSASSPQILLTLNFDAANSKLHVTIEKARNLSHLWHGHQLTNGCADPSRDLTVEPCHAHIPCKDPPRSFNVGRNALQKPEGVGCSEATVGAVQIRAKLLPPDGPMDSVEFRTEWSAFPTERRELPAGVDGGALKPVTLMFKRSYEIRISLRTLCDKTLQLYVFAQRPHSADCVGEAQLSLADFNGRSTTRSRWVNVLGCQFFAVPPAEPAPSLSPPTTCSKAVDDSTASFVSLTSMLCTVGDEWQLGQQTTPLARHLNTLKEESSDESTVIPSQTSTLTRAENCVSLNGGTFCPLVAPDLLSILAPKLSTGCLRFTVNDDSNPDNEPSEGERTLRLSDLLPMVKTCEKETNTDLPISQEEPSCCSSGPFSSTQSPKALHSLLTPNFARKLNRSDSDTSLALLKNEPFRRNVLERRSLRWRKAGAQAACCSKKIDESITCEAIAESRGTKKRADKFRTSIDIHLDLHSAKLRLEQKKEDLEALKSLKSRLELCNSADRPNLPVGQISNDFLLHSLNICGGTANSKISTVICNEDSELTTHKTRNFRQEEKRAQHFIRKAARQVRKLNETKQQLPSASQFWYFKS